MNSQCLKRFFSLTLVQDAQEFFLHLLSGIERAHVGADGPTPAACLQFEAEDRLECGATGKVCIY